MQSLQIHAAPHRWESRQERNNLRNAVFGSGRGVVLRTARNESGERSGVSPPVSRFLYRQADTFALMDRVAGAGLSGAKEAPGFRASALQPRPPPNSLVTVRCRKLTNGPAVAGPGVRFAPACLPTTLPSLCSSYSKRELSTWKENGRFTLTMKQEFVA